MDQQHYEQQQATHNQDRDTSKHMTQQHTTQAAAHNTTKTDTDSTAAAAFSPERWCEFIPSESISRRY
jgi:hypothetical protein